MRSRRLFSLLLRERLRGAAAAAAAADDDDDASEAESESSAADAMDASKLRCGKRWPTTCEDREEPKRGEGRKNSKP